MKDEAQSALRDLVIALERMDSDDLDQFRQEPGVKLLLEWVGHQRPSQTPSPDVMEVWREARKAWRSGSAVVRDEETHSVKIGDSQAAATVIAEAKARWEREAFEKAAQIIASVQPDEEAAGCQASWGDFIQLAQSAIRDGG